MLAFGLLYRRSRRLEAQFEFTFNGLFINDLKIDPFEHRFRS